MLKVADVLSLPRRLGTLQKWCRRRLPLLPIQHQKVIAVKTEKQPSRIAKSSESNMYFFDMRIILSSILSTNQRACLSYWYDWHRWQPLWVLALIFIWISIRTCSRDFASYPDLTSVFPSDFVDYLCDNDDCDAQHTLHLGQVVFFGRDRRATSISKNEVVLEIWPVKKVNKLDGTDTATTWRSISTLRTSMKALDRGCTLQSMEWKIGMGTCGGISRWYEVATRICWLSRTTGHSTLSVMWCGHRVNLDSDVEKEVFIWTRSCS